MYTDFSYVLPIRLSYRTLNRVIRVIVCTQNRHLNFNSTHCAPPRTNPSYTSALRLSDLFSHFLQSKCQTKPVKVTPLRSGIKHDNFSSGLLLTICNQIFSFPNLQEPEPEDIESTACWKIMKFLRLSGEPIKA